MKLSGTIILAPLLGLQLVNGQSSDSASSAASSAASSTGVFSGLTASSGSTISASASPASGSATTTIARLTTAPVASASPNSTSYTPKDQTLWLPLIASESFVASFLGADVCSTLSSYVLNCPSPTPATSCAVGPNMTYTTGPSFANYVRNGASTIACSSTSKGATAATCEATLKSNGEISKTTVTITGTSLSGQAVLVTATPNITTTSTGSAIACTATTTSSSSSTAGAAQATAFGGMAAGAVLVAAIAAM